ncbi:MAG: UDP-N-acetylmuramoyl-tripeptide--D-alanyl-D-alanine ligase [Fidelibacterota bacterium]
MTEETGQPVDTAPGGISLDSREVRPGDLFVAIRGEHADGHDFIGEAARQGAVAALVTRTRPEIDLPQIVVDDSTETLGQVARTWRSQFDLPIIGITGSNGKTTTKDLLVHTFSARHTVHGTRGNYNTRLGLPLTLLELTSHHTLSILEMGANQRGDIGYLCALSFPQHGLITNIAPTHLTGFGSVENITRAKGELFESLPEEGIAFVNGDDDRINTLTTRSKTVTFGFKPGYDFSGELDKDDRGPFVLTVNGRSLPLNSYNRTYAQNVLAVCAVSVTLGISWESLQDSLVTFTPTEGRCTVRTRGTVTIVDDTYNANLASSLAALEFLFSLPGSGRRVVVFADMLELGDRSRSHHKRVGEACASTGVDLLLCCGTESRATAEAAASKIDSRHFRSKKALAADLRRELEEGDTILFKGSRDMALETVIHDLFGR